MQKLFQKKISLTLLFFAIIILLFTGAGCLKQKTTSQITSPTPLIEEITSEVTLVIADGTGNPKTYQQNYKEKMTAYDLLKKVTDTKGITLESSSSSLGVMVNKISDKKGGDEGKYWLYYVNNQMPQVAADKYELKAGDKVEFKFEKGM